MGVIQIFEDARHALEEVKLELAVDSYVRGKTSLARSAEIAGVSLWRFLDELRRRNVAIKYSMVLAEAEMDDIVERRHKTKQ